MQVSKAAASSWASVLIDHALNQTAHARTDARGVHNGLKVAANISLTGAWLDEFGGYTKLLVVRHPVDRMISCYYNVKRFVEGAGMHGPGGEVRRAIKAAFQLHQISDLTLRQFVQFITNRTISGKHYDDRHFNSYSRTCRVCDVTYDHVLRVETMERDARPIVEKLGFSAEYISAMKLSDNTRVTTPTDKVVTSSRGVSKFLPELAELDGSLIELVLQRYQWDMRLFGYHMDVVTNVASCLLSPKYDCA